VFGAAIALLLVRRGVVNEHATLRDVGAVEACRIYWFFVVGVWPILYVLVYLL
jgi:heme/copper-type cytochrome/quinol oxidase subunit 3